MKRRPALRYYGGKWLLAPWIISYFPEHDTYTEAFGGGASVLLRKERAYAEIYNDLDGEIVNLFKTLRDNGPRLKELCRLTPFSRREFVEAYTPSDDLIEQARRTVIKSAMGYGSDGITKNTGFRSYARKERYTIPAHDWANYTDALDFIIERLQGVVIENLPAVEILKKHDGPKTLHYIDPPYIMSTRAGKHLYRHEMSESDHRDLAKILHRLQGNVVLSGYAHPLYESLYAHWKRMERPSKADGARPRTEVLWMKFCFHQTLP